MTVRQPIAREEGEEASERERERGWNDVNIPSVIVYPRALFSSSCQQANSLSHARSLDLYSGSLVAILLFSS